VEVLEDNMFTNPKKLAKVLGISLATVYNRISDGQIPSRRLGNRIIIPVKELTFLNHNPNVEKQEQK